MILLLTAFLREKPSMMGVIVVDISPMSTTRPEVRPFACRMLEAGTVNWKLVKVLRLSKTSSVSFSRTVLVWRLKFSHRKRLL